MSAPRGLASSRRSDGVAWLALFVATGAFLALSIGAAGNYASVMAAHGTTTVDAAFAVAFVGVDGDGNLTASGAVVVTASIGIDNPSPRTLRIRVLGYSGWIEDGPAAAGLNESRRVADDRLVGPSGTRYFYRAFAESFEVDRPPVGPGSNGTYAFTFNLNGIDNPVRFDPVRNITGYAGGVDGPAWNHWVRVQLAIDGVPPASSPTAAPYLRTIGRIEREEGINLVA